MRVYVCGPMRNYKDWNFPAFDAAAERLRRQGFTPVNPADLDRGVGVDEKTEVLPPGFMREAMRRDTDAIIDCFGVAVLPGWEKSAGARAEVALALALDIVIFDAETLEILTVTMTCSSKMVGMRP